MEFDSSPSTLSIGKEYSGSSAYPILSMTNVTLGLPSMDPIDSSDDYWHLARVSVTICFVIDVEGPPSILLRNLTTGDFHGNKTLGNMMG